MTQVAGSGRCESAGPVGHHPLLGIEWARHSVRVRNRAVLDLRSQSVQCSIVWRHFSSVRCNKPGRILP